MAQAPTRKISSGPARKSNTWLMVVTGVVSMGLGLLTGAIPPLSAAISHTIDRFTNRVKTNREMTALMEWYRPVIGKTLNMDPAKVTMRDFNTAMGMNPTLANSVKGAKREEAKENRTSLVINGALASFVPGVAAVEGAAQVVKVMAGARVVGKQLAAATAGGMLVQWASKDILNSQEVIEGISSQLDAAIEQGSDPRKVVTPQMIFLLRVTQDPQLEAAIKKQFHKPVQKMSVEELQQVMTVYQPLANAVTSEAHAVCSGILPVQELMAREPNLNSSADKYRAGAQNSSFVDSLTTQRALAQQAASQSRMN